MVNVKFYRDENGDVYDGMKCPACLGGPDRVYEDHVEQDSSGLRQTNECGRCEYRWTNVYTLSHYLELPRE